MVTKIYNGVKGIISSYIYFIVSSVPGGVADVEMPLRTCVCVLGGGGPPGKGGRRLKDVIHRAWLIEWRDYQW